MLNDKKWHYQEGSSLEHFFFECCIHFDFTLSSTIHMTQRIVVQGFPSLKIIGVNRQAFTYFGCVIFNGLLIKSICRHVVAMYN